MSTVTIERHRNLPDRLQPRSFIDWLNQRRHDETRPDHGYITDGSDVCFAALHTLASHTKRIISAFRTNPTVPDPTPERFDATIIPIEQARSYRLTQSVGEQAIHDTLVTQPIEQNPIAQESQNQ